MNPDSPKGNQITKNQITNSLPTSNAAHIVIVAGPVAGAADVAAPEAHIHG